MRGNNDVIIMNRTEWYIVVWYVAGGSRGKKTVNRKLSFRMITTTVDSNFKIPIGGTAHPSGLLITI